MKSKAKPTFILSYAIMLATVRKLTITQDALNGAGAQGYGKAEIIECFTEFVLEEDFYKTMPSVKQRGKMLDVYRCTYKNVDWYIKFRIEDDALLHIVSFKETK